MNNNRIADLLERRAAIDLELAKEYREEGPQRPRLLDADSSPRWMKLARYATARDISLRSLHDYITRGLPTSGEGRGRRILVQEADAWLAQNAGRASNG